MKKLFTALTLLALSAGLVSAGDYGKNPVTKNPIMVDTGCDCFGTGFEFSGFAAGALPDSGSGELGGGAAIGYFFTENVGVEVSYTVAAFESEEHIVTGNLIYRMPIRDLCIAPYILAGGGVLTNSATDGLFDVGAGLDIRLDSMGCVGIFVDAAYNWVEDDRNFTLVRAGVKIPF